MTDPEPELNSTWDIRLSFKIDFTNYRRFFLRAAFFIWIDNRWKSEKITGAKLYAKRALTKDIMGLNGCSAVPLRSLLRNSPKGCRSIPCPVLTTVPT